MKKSKIRHKGGGYFCCIRNSAKIFNGKKAKTITSRHNPEKSSLSKPAKTFPFFNFVMSSFMILDLYFEDSYLN